jgi:hypothetical protein
MKPQPLDTSHDKVPTLTPLAASAAPANDHAPTAIAAPAKSRMDFLMSSLPMISTGFPAMSQDDSSKLMRKTDCNPAPDS